MSTPMLIFWSSVKPPLLAAPSLSELPGGVESGAVEVGGVVDARFVTAGTLAEPGAVVARYSL